MVFRFRDLPLDVIFEILGHLPAEGIVRLRQVCRRLHDASYQRSVWDNVYHRSDLFLPEGPFPSQSSSQLEALLVRATRVKQTWTLPGLPLFTRRRFPGELPTYNFAANVISGRFLQLAQEDGIAWYDLDSSNIEDPVLTYSCSSVNTISGYMTHQVNANDEGPDTVWVAFLAQVPVPRIVVLKVTFDATIGHNVYLQGEIPAEDVRKIIMDFDWLLLVREFDFPNEPMDLFHVPSMTKVFAPMHEQVQTLTDLNNLNYVISPPLLFLTYTLRSETLVESYTLPKNPEQYSHRRLAKSYSGIYPYAISNIQLVGKFFPMSSTSPACRRLQLSFLALVYVHRSPGTWTSKIGLHMFDVTTNPAGMLIFTTQCQGTLNVGIATTTLSFSARTHSCLAVTHSMPGPVLLAHYIRREGPNCTISVKSIKLPEGLQSRDMLAFDGFRGRLCLINGWTSIEILDCA